MQNNSYLLSIEGTYFVNVVFFTLYLKLGILIHNFYIYYNVKHKLYL
jgi:hypothetical protein